MFSVAGDVMYIAVGAEVPWLARQLQNEYYELIDEHCVHDIMNGECRNLLEGSNFNVE